MGFKDDLTAAKAAVTDVVKTTPTVEIVMNGNTYGIVFREADPLQWSKVTAANSPREDVTLDWNNGYNIAGVTRALSESCGRLIDDGTELELTAEEWADVWSVITPKAARLIEVYVWFLHERDPETEIEDAKKGSSPRRASRKSSS